MAEALPGVLTPLGWTYWRDPCEAGLRAAFADVGVLTRAEAEPPRSIDRRLTGLFYGRWAGNLTVVCELCDRTPGSSGESFEQQVFGYADPDVVRARNYHRYPVISLKMPLAMATVRRRLQSLRTEVDLWWRTATSPTPIDPPAARLATSRVHLRRSLRAHLVASLFAQGCYERVARLAADAGRPGLELELMTGYGGTEEVRVSSDLWDVSRGQASMEEFLLRHGYHGPGEGELSSRSWREDRRPVQRLADSYAEMPDGDGTRAREIARRVVRWDSESALRADLPRVRRPAATLALRAAATYLPLKGVGKVAFLQSIDAGRKAARDIGQQLADDGLIRERDDVFLLTLDEMARRPADARERVESRRELRAAYLEIELPERWTGPPLPVARRPQESSPSTEVRGVAVCPGIVEGRARVVFDPAEADEFAPGDVLVCEATDPGWVVFFQIASAVVIDVGGPLSHGAVVARELGLPAVINTRNGTRTITDGDRVRVNGSTGVVEIIEKARRDTHAT